MFTIKPLQSIHATIDIPADKSISHRALMISALAKGKTVIKNYLESNDTLATLDCMKKMGLKAVFDKKNKTLIVEGKGSYFPRKSKTTLNAGESGTTMRILSGILCGQKFSIKFDAKPALKKRPMRRIVDPLCKLGANITGIEKQEKIYPPLNIKPVKKLKGGEFRLNVASAQVKSALLLAGLYTKEKVSVLEPMQSRDHTERMLKLFGANIQTKDRLSIIEPGSKLVSPKNIFVPADISSAAFFIVLGLIAKNSHIVLKNININHTRTGLLKVLERMGAKITIMNRTNDYEPYADLIIETSALKGTIVNEDEIPLMVDEVPILCVAAAFASTKTVIFGVKELKVKETDRIESMVKNLKAAGVNIWAGETKNKYGQDDYVIMIDPTNDYKAANFKSMNDHRTAMSMIVFALGLGKECKIDDIKCIDKSFPEFIPTLKKLYAPC